jgi:hypothetical protein
VSSDVCGLFERFSARSKTQETREWSRRDLNPRPSKLLNVVLFEIDAFSLQRLSAKVRVFIDMLVDRFGQQRHGKSLMACAAAVPWPSEFRETS